MSEQARISPEKEPRDAEYAELRRRIIAGGWTSGDSFCTSQGVTWQFRETPYTSDFPQAPERTSTSVADASSIPDLRGNNDDNNGNHWTNRGQEIFFPTPSPGSPTLVDAPQGGRATAGRRMAHPR
jgi:hypothetical protein